MLYKSYITYQHFISYSKYRPLPLTVQGGPVGLVGWKKIILASLRYFFRQALHWSLAKNSRASKKLKYWLHGAGHV